MKHKKCISCELELPLDNFYTHKQMKDGHINKCKECVKLYSKEREKSLRKDPEWVLKEQNRQRLKYHSLGYKDTNKPTNEQKKLIISRYNRKFPEKALARKYTEIYLTKIDGYNLHHWSYNQEDWLDVIELTVKEHHFLHRYIIYDQERMMYRTLTGVLLDTKEKHLEYLKECKSKYEFLG